MLTTRQKLAVLGRNKCQFLRWAWLRMTGKTAHRFTPLYLATTDIEGGITQANGLYLPWGGRGSGDEIDWDVAFREQFEKADAAAKKNHRKKLKS